MECGEISDLGVAGVYSLLAAVLFCWSGRVAVGKIQVEGGLGFYTNIAVFLYTTGPLPNGSFHSRRFSLKSLASTLRFSDPCHPHR